MVDRLRGKVVAITGAGQGIGADVARRLVAQGAQVALLDRMPETIDNLARELGDAAAPFTVDVTDDDQVAATIDAVYRHFGHLDVVVANAGVMDPSLPVAETTPAQFRRLLEVNVVGVFNTVHAALPYLTRSHGYILCTASLAGLVPVPTIASYVASKHAVDGFARSLRLEMATAPVDVGVAYFGVIDTPMATTAISHVSDVWSALPGPIGRPARVGAAGKAIVNGINRRASSVYAPRWLAGVLLATRSAAAAFETVARLHPSTRSLLKKNDPASV